MEGLKECEASMVVQIHPSKSKSVTDAILGELSSLLFTYNETYQGVILAYDPTHLSSLAKVLPGIHPYLGVNLDARLLLFDPKPNMHIDGEVVKITRHSIHVVVLGFSSAVIAYDDIRDEFKFKNRDSVFVSRVSKKHKIRVGSIVRFLVKSFDHDVLHFSGSMIDGSTGCVKWLDKNLGKWDGTESSELKRKVKHDEEVVVALEEESTKLNKKKKKKRRVKDEVEDN